MAPEIEAIARIIWRYTSCSMSDAENAAKALYENGYRDVSESKKVAETLQILKNIAGALGVTVDELIGGN